MNEFTKLRNRDPAEQMSIFDPPPDGERILELILQYSDIEIYEE